MNTTEFVSASNNWVHEWPTLLLAFVAVAVAVLGPYIADLVKKRYLGPKLVVEFSNQHKFCHQTKKRYWPYPPDHPSHNQFEEFTTYYFRFAVRNEGKSLARACEVVLENIYSADNNGNYNPIDAFWPTNLKWEGGRHQIDINPKRPLVFADVGHICHPEAQVKFEFSQYVGVSQSDTRLRFILDLSIRHFAKIDSLTQGKYLLKVVILGENFDPIIKCFLLSWLGIWTESEELMLKQEDILEMKDWTVP